MPRGGTRIPITLRRLVPETSASTNSVIWTQYERVDNTCVIIYLFQSCDASINFSDFSISSPIIWRESRFQDLFACFIQFESELVLNRWTVVTYLLHNFSDMLLDDLSIVVLHKLLSWEEEYFFGFGRILIIPSGFWLFESADIISNLQEFVVFLISCSEIYSVAKYLSESIS